MSRSVDCAIASFGLAWREMTRNDEKKRKFSWNHDVSVSSFLVMPYFLQIFAWDDYIKAFFIISRLFSSFLVMYVVNCSGFLYFKITAKIKAMRPSSWKHCLATWPQQRLLLRKVGVSSPGKATTLHHWTYVHILILLILITFIVLSLIASHKCIYTLKFTPIITMMSFHWPNGLSFDLSVARPWFDPWYP